MLAVISNKLNQTPQVQMMIISVGLIKHRLSFEQRELVVIPAQSEEMSLPYGHVQVRLGLHRRVHQPVRMTDNTTFRAGTRAVSQPRKQHFDCCIADSVHWWSEKNDGTRTPETPHRRETSVLERCRPATGVQPHPCQGAAQATVQGARSWLNPIFAGVGESQLPLTVSCCRIAIGQRQRSSDFVDGVLHSGLAASTPA